MSNDDKTRSEITEKLLESATDISASELYEFGELLLRVLKGQLLPVDAQKEISENTDFVKIFQSLQGKIITTNNTTLSFGQDSQIGDMTIRDVVGRDSIQFVINIGSDNKDKILNNSEPSVLGEEIALDKKIIFHQRVTEYVSIYIYVILIYGLALGANFVIFFFVNILFSGDMQKYGILSTIVEYARIGSNLLFIASALIHSFLSTVRHTHLIILHSQKG